MLPTCDYFVISAVYFYTRTKNNHPKDKTKENVQSYFRDCFFCLLLMRTVTEKKRHKDIAFSNMYISTLFYGEQCRRMKFSNRHLSQSDPVKFTYMCVSTP
jgi:hypothetical protein